jgi:hypothetical protein
VKFTGLTNGKAYTFTVVTRNVAGNSAPSAVSTVTPRTVPGSPIIGTSTAGNGEATKNWSSPSETGGADIIGYTVTPSERSPITTDSTVRSAKVTGLTNGTAYKITVIARNVAGNSAPSELTVTPLATRPDPPTGVSAVAGAGQATVSWIAPAITGGLPITGYKIISELTEEDEVVINSNNCSVCSKEYEVRVGSNAKL